MLSLRAMLYENGVILKPQNPTSQGRAMLTGGVGSIQELRPIQSTGLAQPLLETAEEIALELKLFPISQAHTVTFFSDGMHHWFLATVLSPPALCLRFCVHQVLQPVVWSLGQEAAFWLDYHGVWSLLLRLPRPHILSWYPWRRPLVSPKHMQAFHFRVMSLRVTHFRALYSSAHFSLFTNPRSLIYLYLHQSKFSVQEYFNSNPWSFNVYRYPLLKKQKELN